MESDDIKASIGKWLEDETNLLAIASFSGSELVLKECRVSRLIESGVKLVTFTGNAQLVFDFSGMTFGYTQAREVPSFRAILTEELLERSAVCFVSKDGSQSLIIIETMPLG